VEKDYWIMHAVFGLKQPGLTFELKGGRRSRIWKPNWKPPLLG